MKNLTLYFLFLHSFIALAKRSPFEFYEGNYKIVKYSCLDFTCPKLEKNIVTIAPHSAQIGRSIDVEFEIYSEGEDEYWQLGEFSEREHSATYSERGFYKGLNFHLVNNNVNSSFTLSYSIRKNGEVFDLELELERL